MNENLPEVLNPEILIVEEGESAVRLDVFVAARLKVSRERAKKLLQDATVNGVAVKSSRNMEIGDKVALIIVEEIHETKPETAFLEKRAAESEMPPIIFEDEFVLVINKPRGLVVHEGAGETGSTLVEILRAHGRQLSGVGPTQRAGIVHRLDKDTSGVMAVCKTDAAHWKLAADFAERRVRKEYSAIVCGVPRAPGRVEAPLDRHPKNRKKMAVVASGKMAITEYSVVQSWERFAQLNVNILTGRTHQIRVHLAYLNYPVVGDEVYGGLNRALENMPNDEGREAVQNLNGQALHAANLTFSHPITDEKLIFHAPLPEVMTRVIDALNLPAPIASE